MTTFWVTTVAAKCGSRGCWTHTDGLVVLPFTGSNANGIYRAVNESAFLNITAAGSLYEVRWLKDSKKLLQIKDKKVRYYVNKYQCRCKIFLNGTLQIEQVMKEDSGNYTVTVYQQDGKLKAEEVMNLVVQGEFLLFSYHSQHSWEYLLLSPTTFSTHCPPFCFGGTSVR